MEKQPETESLISEALAELNRRLPDGWSAERTAMSAGAGRSTDAAISIRTPNGHSGVLLIEAKTDLGPRDAGALFSGIARTLRDASPVEVLVISPWLSPRTRERLRVEEANYLDLTGNAQIALSNPPLLLSWDGADRNPRRAGPSGRPTLRGPKAMRLVRFLIDVEPPYRVSDAAELTGLTVGYVSRLLEALDAQAVITRGHRGVVENVDWEQLIRLQAEQYDVFKPDRVRTFVARGPLREVAAQLTGSGRRFAAVTGSFAAVELAPVAAPALLALYCEDIDDAAREAGLLPADEGGNVALIRAFDEVLSLGTRQLDAFRSVAPAQVAIDCLTGTGRMPAEGEAVIGWMAERRDQWQVATSEWLPEEGFWS